MGDQQQGRMLLSHNFNVSTEVVPALSREAFVEVFQTGLSAHSGLHCLAIDHPHWIAAIQFPTETYTPIQVGELCAQALQGKRRSQSSASGMHTILILGGVKTTPPTSSSPTALQPGEWGVDVVETASGEAFLQQINWDTTIAQRPADSVFKVTIAGA
ncbi:MAG: DUF2656 family protein [Cyanobacteria bacterium J06638_28]